MLKLSRWLSFIMVLALCFAAKTVWASVPFSGPPAGAMNKSRPSGPPGELKNKARFLGLATVGQGYDTQKEKTLSGIIEEISTVKGKADRANYVVQITIRGKSEKLCKVELAPYWYIQSQYFSLPVGEKVKVRGFVKPDGDNYRMLALSVSNDKRTLNIRNKLGVPFWNIKPQNKQALKRDKKVVKQRQVVSVAGDLSPEVESQRPTNYGPPAWDPEELPWWIAWVGPLLNSVLELLGGPESALLIMLGVLLIVMIRTLSSKKSSWRKIKAKHGKI